MEIKIKELEDVTLIELLQNGQPPSPSNPITPTDLADLFFPDANGKLAIISGMPMSIICAIAMRYKNTFGVIAIANPRDNNALVAHSLSPQHPLGSTIPLPSLV